MKLLKASLLACVLMLGTQAHAQDWKSILSGVAKAVGEKVSETSTSFSLAGTWKYVGQDCKFQSDNLLAKAGSELAAKSVEEKMQQVMDKLGFSEGCTFVFNADSTYTSTVKGKTTQGTYSYNATDKELKLKTRLGIGFTATVSYNVLTPGKMSLLFNADKLMDLTKTVGSVASKASSNSTLSTLTSLLDQYNGLQLGFEMERQP